MMMEREYLSGEGCDIYLVEALRLLRRRTDIYLAKDVITTANLPIVLDLSPPTELLERRCEDNG